MKLGLGLAAQQENATPVGSGQYMGVAENQRGACGLVEESNGESASLLVFGEMELAGHGSNKIGRGNRENVNRGRRATEQPKGKKRERGRGGRATKTAGHVPALEWIAGAGGNIVRYEESVGFPKEAMCGTEVTGEEFKQQQEQTQGWEGSVLAFKEVIKMQPWEGGS